MSFLSKIFKKKPGGTLFGNLLRGATSAIPVIGGTVVGTGANKIELGQTKTNAQLAQETFAGVPATTSSDGTINISNPLNEVSISAPSLVKNPSNTTPAWLDKLGDTLSYLGNRTTENTKVGADDKTLLVVGGSVLALALVIFMSKK